MGTETKFAGLRARLEQERQSLLDDINTLQIENQAQPDDYGIGNHLADDASEVVTRDVNLALRGNSQDLLAQVEAALLRMDDGTYGVCARCGQPINPDRLEALPYATYCITCQSEVEHQR
jgi:DnaK suppressor protein